jgi:carbon storage regulator
VVLVLSRRRNEKIVIGDDITITVLEVRGDQIQLGIQAPRSVPVHRWEVFRAIQDGAGGPGSASKDSGRTEED